jgi:hypothetical protein
MTDERDDNEMQPGEYDDDRLLACALGLEEDPELLAAAAADAGLAARLASMRADVEHIGAQVSAAVPEPDETYTDLSGERWGGLKEFLEAPPATAPRRRRSWWQVVAPVAAVLVIAVIVGIVAVQNGTQSATSDSSGAEVARSDDAAGGSGSAQSLGEGVTKSTATGQTTTSSPTFRERFADQLGRFGVVVLARAREVSGAVQKFAVLRIFKGSAPKTVELVVNDDPADRGRLHLLLLDPTASPQPVAPSVAETPWPLTESPTADTASPLPLEESPWPDESLSPEPIPTLAAANGPGEPLAVAYTYNGEPTMVREFAAGTDPDSVSLRIP